MDGVTLIHELGLSNCFLFPFENICATLVALLQTGESRYLPPHSTKARRIRFVSNRMASASAMAAPPRMQVEPSASASAAAAAAPRESDSSPVSSPWALCFAVVNFDVEYGQSTFQLQITISSSSLLLTIKKVFNVAPNFTTFQLTTLFYFRN